MKQKGNRGVRFDDPDSFFEEDGSVWMRLTRAGAVEVARRASNQKIIIVMVEGGAWQYPGFKSKLDAIWKSKIDPPCDVKAAEHSNRQAKNFIENCSSETDVFIITAPPITGYRHNS
jgi:hypothetical protein